MFPLNGPGDYWLFHRRFTNHQAILAGKPGIRKYFSRNQGFQITGETYPANGFDGYSSVPSVKYWNPGTQAYVGISSTLNPIANDYGYMAFIRGDRTITTTHSRLYFTVIRTSGSVKTGKYPSSAISGSGPVGFDRQPYASAINFNNVTRTGGVPNTFYVWDPLLTSGSGSRYGFGGFRTITWDSGSGSYIVTPSGGSYTSNTDIELALPFCVCSAQRRYGFIPGIQ